MPEATIAQFNLEGKTPSELEQRRRDIIAEMTLQYRGYDDPNLPIGLLQELAAVTSSLRRRTAGPPKANKTAAQKRKPPPLTTNEILDF